LLKPLLFFIPHTNFYIVCVTHSSPLLTLSIIFFFLFLLQLSPNSSSSLYLISFSHYFRLHPFIFHSSLSLSSSFPSQPTPSFLDFSLASLFFKTLFSFLLILHSSFRQPITRPVKSHLKNYVHNS
jgi:hypothetical protein